MKHFFHKTIIYQCDLGDRTLVSFLPDCSKKIKWFSISENWKKGFNDGFYLQEKISENHIIVWQVRDRFSPNVDIQYRDDKILINIMPSLNSYIISIVPIIITIYALIPKLDPSIYFVCFAFFIFTILLQYFGVNNTLNNTKRQLELELRYNRISYQVIDGESIYPPS